MEQTIPKPDKNELLEKLLKENLPNRAHNFKRIEELAKKVEEMRSQQSNRVSAVEAYFNEFRTKMEKTNANLQMAKQGLESLNMQQHRDRAAENDSMDYGDFLSKTEEEIDREMDLVENKLRMLRSGIDVSSGRMGENYDELVKILESVGKSDLTDDL